MLLFLADHYIFNINKANFTSVSTLKIRLGPQISQWIKSINVSSCSCSLFVETVTKDSTHTALNLTPVWSRSPQLLSLFLLVLPHHSGSPTGVDPPRLSVGKHRQPVWKRMTALGRCELHLFQTLSPVCAQPYI